MTKNHKILICVAILAVFSLTVAFAVNGGKTSEKPSSATCTISDKCGLKAKGMCDGNKAACPKTAKKKAASGVCVKDICSDPCYLEAGGLCHLKAEGLCDGNKAACPILAKKAAGCCKDGCDCCGGCEDGTCICEDCRCCVKAAGCCKDGCDCCGGCEDGTCICEDCRCCVKAACDCCKDGTCTCEDCQCDNCCCMQ